MTTITTKTTARSKASEVIGHVQSFKAKDGSRLFYRAWGPQTAEQAVILLGDYGSNENSLASFAAELSALDAAVFVLDRRDSGQSQGANSASHFGQLVDDLDQFVRHICCTSGLEEADIVAVGHGLGGLELLTWGHDYAPRLRHVILLEPTLSDLTANGHLAETQEAAQRILDDAGAIVLPVTFAAASPASRSQTIARERCLQNLRGPSGFIELSGRIQATNLAVVREINSLVEKALSRSPLKPDLTNAHRAGYTFDEYETLRKPLSFGFKSLSFAIQRAALGTVGRLSRGVQIGWGTGFDSGVSLDHVYENEARGTTWFGQAIDRFYLDAVGWKGIRQRRIHMQRQLAAAITEAARHGRSVRILDIAAGAGRYVLETVRDHQHSKIEVELRDFHQHNLDKAKLLAVELGLTDVRFKQHDAFATESYVGLEDTIDIAIVSGLYELFPDNDAVVQSLAGIRSALKPGGTLIYTNQPWHPQLEMIARVLPSHRGGDSWVMRRRTQAEMDQLVRRAGLTKTDMDIDRWGIFTVSTTMDRE